MIDTLCNHTITHIAALAHRLMLKLSGRQARVLLLVALLTTLAAVVVQANPAHIDIIDSGGPNDPSGDGQRDLTRYALDILPSNGQLQLEWNWDETGLPGANTGDACALIDTDMDGLANYALCVTISGDPAVQSGVSPRLYSCTENPPGSSADRCTGATLVGSAGGLTSTCSVAQSGDDPFPTGDASPNDTKASCTFDFADITPTTGTLINVCSYPSQEPNSAPGDCVGTPGTGNIVIVKDTVPDDPQDFNYSTTGGLTPSTFTLDDDPGSATPTNMRVFSSVGPGEYTVTETVAGGFALTAISCTDPDNGSSVDVDTETATIDLDAGETVECTFTNIPASALPSITIVKDTMPDGPQDFGYTGDLGSFTLDDDPGDATWPNTQLFSGLTNGNSYQVTETTVAGFTLSNIVCTGATNSTVQIGGAQDDGDFDPGDTRVDITIQNDEAVTCTFTNTEEGSIKIVKNAVPDSEDDFTFTGAGTGVNANFTLEDDGNTGDGQLAEITFGSLLPGNYSITETPIPAGWDLTNIACTGATGSTISIEGAIADGDFDGGDDTVAISLAAGEDIECTFENTQEGTITIVKDALPADGTDFSFTTTTATTTVNVTLDDDGGADTEFPDTQEFTNLPAGAYTVEEIVPADWQLTDITCTTDDSSSVIIEDGAAPGFENQAEPELNGEVDPGFNAGDTKVTIQLGDDGSATCTFTNTEEGSLTIVKDAVPNSEQDFSFVGVGTGVAANFTLEDDGDPNDGQPAEITFEPLLPGSFAINETVPAGWGLTNIVCTGATASTVSFGAVGPFVPGDTSVSINLVAGEDVVCTFTNTEEGSITIVKQLVGAAPGTPWSFSGTLGDFTLPAAGGGETFGELLPGGYTITEDAVDDYETEVSCTSGETGTNSVTVGLGAGGDVTCTFTNTFVPPVPATTTAGLLGLIAALGLVLLVSVYRSRRRTAV